MRSKGTIYVPEWMRIYPYLMNMNVSKVSFAMRLSYAHAYHIVAALRDAGLVTVTKEGRSNRIEYTKHGEWLLRHIVAVLESVKNIPQRR